MIPEFPEADYYDCQARERLMYPTPEEAVEAYLEDVAESGSDVLADIEKLAPVDVVCYRRIDPDLESIAEYAIERIHEYWCDNYADPDGGGPEAEGRKSQAFPAVVELVKAVTAKWEVWGCEDFKAVTLDAAQVEEMMRRYRPGWFETKGPTS